MNMMHDNAMTPEDIKTVVKYSSVPSFAHGENLREQYRPKGNPVKLLAHKKHITPFCIRKEIKVSKRIRLVISINQ